MKEPKTQTIDQVEDSLFKDVLLTPASTPEEALKSALEGLAIKCLYDTRHGGHHQCMLAGVPPPRIFSPYRDT